MPGDNYWNDQAGDNLFNGLYEGGNTILYQGGNITIPTEGCLENPFTGNGVCDNFGQVFGSDNFIPSIHDCGLDGLFAKKVLNNLVANGIFVRMPFTSPQNRCIRVSAGTEDDMELFKKFFPIALNEAKRI